MRGSAPWITRQVTKLATRRRRCVAMKKGGDVEGRAEWSLGYWLSARKSLHRAHC